MSKDEIIEAVWPGQVVTDAALTKQIMRLRTLLDDNDPVQPVIETHRGVGYRFTANIESQNIEKPAQVPRPAQNHKWSGLTVLAVLLLAVILYVQTRENSANSEATLLTAGLPINLAIIPSTDSKDWINIGGLEYLAELLGQHKLIQSISPDTEWYSSGSPEQLAINLTTNSSIDYSCLVKLSKTSEGYSANLKLRTNNNILASTILNSASLAELFESTNQWVGRNLSVHDQLDARLSDNSDPVDPFALQSYLQGIFEVEVSGDKKQALTYFQTAVTKDPDFQLAWIKLAAAELDLGNFDKAIAIANTQLNKLADNNRQKITIELNYIKAMAYYRLRDNDLSEQSIQESIVAIETTQDPYIKLAGLKSLRFLAGLKNDWKAAEKHVRESLLLSKKDYPLPNHIANLSLDLARIKMLQKQAPQAREHLQEALKYYQASANSNGMMASLCVLNRINLSSDSFDDGILVAATAEPHLQTSTEPHEQACFLSTTGIIFNLRGYFDRSIDYSDRLTTLSRQSGNEFYQFLAEFNLVHMQYVQNEFELAMQHVNSMRSTIVEASKLPSVRYGFIAVDILISSRALAPETALKNINTYLQRQPELNDYFAEDISRARGHLFVREGQIAEGLDLLKSAESAYRTKLDIPLANYVGYEILEILLQHPDLSYQDTIDRIEASSNYAYQFSKLKAQFKARESNYSAAGLLMEENKLKANQYWKAEDQLLLEQYQLAAQ